MPQGLTGEIAALIVGTISATGYAGVALLMAIESACIPLPSEVIMPFAGYLASTGRLGLPLAAAAGALGCNLGSALAYEVGRRGGRRLVERWGAYVLLGRRDLDLADPGAVERALELGAADADAVRLILEHARERPVGLFCLDGRPHLKLVSVPSPDLGGYASLTAGVAP